MGTAAPSSIAGDAPSLIDALLRFPPLQGRLATPDRKVVVVDVTGAAHGEGTLSVRIDEGQYDGAVPLDSSDLKFSRDLSRTWSQYDVTRTVPVVVINLKTSFTGLLLRPLPGLSAEERRAMCTRCCATDHAEADCPP